MGKPREFWIEYDGEGALAFVYDSKPADWIEGHEHFIRAVDRAAYDELVRELAEFKKEPITIALIKACRRNEEYIEQRDELVRALEEISKVYYGRDYFTEHINLALKALKQAVVSRSVNETKETT